MSNDAVSTTEMALPKIKSYFQRSLVRLGIYQRIKASWIYDCYWSLADRRITDDRQSEVEFYRAVLEGFREGDLIFDVGANQGYKTYIFLRLGAKVVAVEPDGISQQMLKHKFLKYRLKSKPLVIVAKAVSDRNSKRTLWIDTPGSAKNTLSEKWAEALRGDDGRFGSRLSFGQSTEVETVSLSS